MSTSCFAFQTLFIVSAFVMSALRNACWLFIRSMSPFGSLLRPGPAPASRPASGHRRQVPGVRVVDGWFRWIGTPPNASTIFWKP